MERLVRIPQISAVNQSQNWPQMLKIL